MNEVERIRQMAQAGGEHRRSTAESGGVGDVTDWVLLDIRQNARQETSDLRILASIGGVLAVLAIGLSVGAWSMVSDPTDDVTIQAATVLNNPLNQASTLLDEGNP